MTASIKPSSFGPFFREVHGFEPFPWQVRLAESVCGGAWPATLDLPTASGKTSCLDVAVFALAVSRGNAARRIFMTVDRRLIVDQAYAHACRLRDALHAARGGIVAEVAQVLRAVAGGDEDRDAWPLLVTRLRGGVRDDALWCRSPLQPTVVCTTVDQVGSRLLFRGYGVSPRAWPIHAGLVACDSLVLLDEAHCSEPFRQTLASVKQAQATGGEAAAGLRPLEVVELSATPRTAAARFQLDESDGAHPVLGARLSAYKSVELVTVPGRLATAADSATASDALADEAVRRVRDFLTYREGTPGGISRVAVVVNRVDRARRIARYLLAAPSIGADVRLVIGAMRPIDRDRLESELRERVGSGSKLTRPIVVVATQCIEVGADLDFDAMISEAAPIDALRQRFGRLNRTGRPIDARGAVMMPKLRADKSLDEVDPDPIYGTSDLACWNFLEATAIAGERSDGKKRVATRVCDFGTNAMSAAIAARFGADAAGFAGCITPAKDAPCLLPAYVDILAQTNPAPAIEPELSLFLHGVGSENAEVSICFRSDLPPRPDQEASEPARAVAMRKLSEYFEVLPPVSSECLPARIGAVARWLRGASGNGSDLPVGDDGAAALPQGWQDSGSEARLALLVRAPSRGGEPQWMTSSSTLQPGDVLVVSVEAVAHDHEGAERSSAAGLAVPNWDALGVVPSSDDWHSDDRADEAWARDRSESRVRLHSSVLQALSATTGVPLPGAITAGGVAEWDAVERETWAGPLQTWVAALLESAAVRAEGPARRTTEALAAALVGGRGLRVAPHPAGGLVFSRPMRVATDGVPPALVLPTELSCGGAPLEAHCAGVALLARQFAAALSLPRAIIDAMHDAGLWHDLGKADGRFQAMLRGGVGFGPLLAKSLSSSANVPQAVAATGWPRGGRHEALSLAAVSASACLHDKFADLSMHLIATHHGWARPFLPPFEAALEGLDASLHGCQISIYPEQLQLPDARTADRFWHVVDAYGAWGIAFLEAVFRLADARRSEAEELAANSDSMRCAEVSR